MKSLVERRNILLSLLTALLLAACNLPTRTTPAPSAAVDPDAVATVVAATLAAELGDEEPAIEPTATPAEPGLLPYSLYYLSESSGSAQVWRLDANGQNPQQITSAAAGVDAYDVSPASGQLAFVSDNQLWLAEADGSDAQLIADGGEQRDDDPDYYYRDLVGSPRFSPDGRWLAFGHDGVRLYDTLSGDSRHLIQNDLGQADGGVVIVRELYFPESWSPNGEHLLTTIGFLEGGSLAILDPQTAELTRFQAGGIVCCQTAWTRDSRSVYVASPYIGLVEPGLWRYAVSDGSEDVLFTQEEGLFQFAGWPVESENVELRYFYASTTEYPDGNLPLTLVQAAADGVFDRTPLRSETFNPIEALWAPDAELVLVVQENVGVYGTVLLVDISGDTAQVWANEARQLRWGP